MGINEGEIKITHDTHSNLHVRSGERITFRRISDIKEAKKLALKFNGGPHEIFDNDELLQAAKQYFSNDEPRPIHKNDSFLVLHDHEELKFIAVSIDPSPYSMI